jgi:restriction endonuclease Mrr
LELAVIEQIFDVDIELKGKWLGSEKALHCRGTYRAKIGFDLTKGFRIEILSARIFRPGQVIFYMPGAEILSIEALDIERRVLGGVINWVTEKDREDIDKQLVIAAKDRASKLEMLEDAERRIENRLRESLWPKLNYATEYNVKFIQALNEEYAEAEENG